MLRFFKRKNNRKLAELLPEGFHGDRYTQKLVNFLIQDCKYFIETGSNVGSTLSFVARTYPSVQCLSCEPDNDAIKEARKNTAAYGNVTIYHELSQKFLERLDKEFSHLYNEKVLFWLDAHGYGFKWPLKDELAFIMKNFKKAYILIDDFKVPGKEMFVYDQYETQICSYDYVKDAIPSSAEYDLYYPGYTEKTSNFHPLQGWGLFDLSRSIQFPDEIIEFVEKK